MSMHRIRYSPTHEGGFTLMELLVSMTISSITMAMVVGGALTFRNTYSTDVVRTRTNGNLRSGMDIISMNIRQAGENLLSTFPAVLLTNASGSTSDVLTLRRGLIPEVLTLCADAASSTTTLFVSSADGLNSECVFSNVTPLYTIFNNLRDDEGGSLRLYIYDKVAHLGEYVNFTAGSSITGQYQLSTSALTRAYPRLNTSIYLIEEYQFSFDSAERELVLLRDGDDEVPRPVAFDITQFAVSIEVEDGTTITSLSAGDETDWKDISQIVISLSGNGSYKGHTMSSTISAKFFPRNVLSYEG